MDTAAGTGTFAWHTPHSTSRLITDTSTEEGSPKSSGINQLRPKRRKNQREIGEKIKGKFRSETERTRGKVAGTGTLAAGGRTYHRSLRDLAIASRSFSRAPVREGEMAMGSGEEGSGKSIFRGNIPRERKRKGFSVRFTFVKKPSFFRNFTYVSIAFYNLAQMLSLYSCNKPLFSFSFGGC